jgi:5-methylcytosine-specific restriction endonuclease McrA
MTSNQLRDEYTCASCRGVFDKERSDTEAVAESEAKFGMPVSEETHAIVCDDCFQRMFNQ